MADLRVLLTDKSIARLPTPKEVGTWLEIRS